MLRGCVLASSKKHLFVRKTRKNPLINIEWFVHTAGRSFYFTEALQARYTIHNPVQPYNSEEGLEFIVYMLEFWIKTVGLTARVLQKLIHEIHVGSKAMNWTLIWVYPETLSQNCVKFFITRSEVRSVVMWWDVAVAVAVTWIFDTIKLFQIK